MEKNGKGIFKSKHAVNNVNDVNKRSHLVYLGMC